MKHKFQISESIRLGAILALSVDSWMLTLIWSVEKYLPMHRLETCFSFRYISLRETSEHTEIPFPCTRLLHLELPLLKLSGLRQEILLH